MSDRRGRDPLPPGAGESSTADEAITREARTRRGFTVASALAAHDDGSHLRGGSPIAAQRQFALAVAQWLERALPDPEGSLRLVLAREIGDRADLVGDDPGRPQAAVAAWLQELLASDVWLRDLVREVDSAWGRRQVERPRFEQPGASPAPDDPYTVAGVSTALTALLDRARREIG